MCELEFEPGVQGIVMIRGAMQARVVTEVAEPTLGAKVRFLQDGAHLGEPGVPVECVETHFAWVFLTPRHVYKLRKPVRYRNLDTASPAARYARCKEELRLNQALAPEVYLEVLPLTLASDGRMELGRTGLTAEPLARQTVDWLLHMRRLPARRMLDRMIREGVWEPADLDVLTLHLQTFYAQQPRVRLCGAAYCRRLSAQVRRNVNELLAAESFGVETASVLQVAQLQTQWIDTHRSLLRQRAEQGHIRDCHGDLKPEHVCLGPPVSVIDRLEFDADLRLLDPLEDLCFLWLECARLGAAPAGERIVRRYLAASGAEVPEALAAFYLSHRALTRAKLAAWRLGEPGGDRARWRERVGDYLARASGAVHSAMGESGGIGDRLR